MEDLYDDPGLSAFDYETGLTGQIPIPGRGQEMLEDDDGYLPQEPSDIYGMCECMLRGAVWTARGFSGGQP